MGQSKPEAKTADKPKDRIDLRLFNTILIFDVYVVARTAETARECLLAAIRQADDPQQPSESVARDVTMKNSIRQSWVEQKPLYASDVTDEEFEANRPYGTMELYERFYEKRG